MTGAYDLPPHSPGFAEAQADMAARSVPARDLPGQFDIAYGDHQRQKLDIFPAGKNAPAIVFLRGGYWKFGEKEDRHFPALEWLPRGVTWIVPNYRLAPDAHLADIVEDAEAAFQWVLDHGADHGVDLTQLHLVGNSAGAHLAAMIASGPNGSAVRSLTLISGLFDLLPLLQEEPNSWLKLNRGLALQLSPALRLPRPDLPVTVAVGGGETAAFVKQSKDYFDALKAHGSPVHYVESPSQNHMEIIAETGTPGTPVFAAMEQHVAAAR